MTFVWMYLRACPYILISTILESYEALRCVFNARDVNATLKWLPIPRVSWFLPVASSTKSYTLWATNRGSIGSPPSLSALFPVYSPPSWVSEYAGHEGWYIFYTHPFFLSRNTLHKTRRLKYSKLSFVRNYTRRLDEEHRYPSNVICDECTLIVKRSKARRVKERDKHPKMPNYVAAYLCLDCALRLILWWISDSIYAWGYQLSIFRWSWSLHP
jgi:hypothetical protein